MANVRNVIVGAAQVFVSRGANELRPATYYKAQYYGTAPAVSWSDSQSARGWLMGTVGAAQWRDVGYTNNGLEVSYEPGYGDVMVDQLLDAARLFKQSIKITLRTELAEGTLENMALAFGQPDPSLEFSASTGSITAASVLQTLTGATVTAATGYAALGLAAGALGDQPVERSIIAIGQAPEQFGSNLRTGAPTFTQTSTQSATGSAAFALLAGAALANVGSASSGSTAYGNNEAGTYGSMRERVYIARRVVQMDASTHSLKRDTGVTFPVTFRCLPDDNDVYDAAEYGVVIDRIYSVF